MGDQFISVITWVMLILEVVLLGLILRNICRYVCGQRKYREFQMLSFYSIAFWIVMLRISFHVLTLLMNKTGELYDSLIWEAWVIGYFCRQLENILAVQQISSMIDLQLMVKFLALNEMHRRNKNKTHIQSQADDGFDPEAYKIRVKRYSMLFRVIGFIIGIFLLSSATAFCILKKEVV